ncbi:MAG: hypothetical protein EKK40_11165 [Bradyrhizobiaceae bacterium]|nr:MAG: hypothetical protein EKK40_11165 [Bradyrhizobiaceae bacterium]
MKRILLAILCLGVVVRLAGAQAVDTPAPPGNYVPSLGDIMSAMQLRHFKLWFAGRLKNWDLAAYELDRIKSSFADAMGFYPGIPVADMTAMGPPAQQIDEAIKAKDSKEFARAFGDLTVACNSCHQAIGRGFIVVQVPTSSPFSNQSFAPAASK